jgi:hypothetical protein
MSQATKDKLLAALSNNALEIHQTAVALLGKVSEVDWQRILDRIAKLQKVQKELEEGLKQAQINSPSSN